MNARRYVGRRSCESAPGTGSGRVVPLRRPAGPRVGEPGDSGPAVCVRFTPSEIPVLTSSPAHKTAVIRAAGRALATLGRSYLGGHLEISSDTPPHRGCALAVSERIAAVRAVQNAMAGGCGAVRLPLPERWPGPEGGTGETHTDPCSCDPPGGGPWGPPAPTP
jgi:hypothetical protein